MWRDDSKPGPKGDVFTHDGAGISKFSGDGKFIWRSKLADLYHFAVRPDGMLVGTCDHCKQLRLMDPRDGRIIERWDEPKMDGDGFGPTNLDRDGNIYVHAYGSDSQLIFDPSGTYLGSDTRTTVGGPGAMAPVFGKAGLGYLFVADGLLELRVNLTANAPKEPSVD